MSDREKMPYTPMQPEAATDVPPSSAAASTLSLHGLRRATAPATNGQTLPGRLSHLLQARSTESTTAAYGFNSVIEPEEHTSVPMNEPLPAAELDPETPFTPEQ